jgi:hypothetical protein
MLAVAVACVLPLRLLTADESAAPGQAFACGPALSALEQLKGNIGMDTGIATRAGSLAEGLGTGRPPAPDQIQQLAADSMDSLTEAGTEVEQIAEQMGNRLESSKLPRQARAWKKGLAEVRSARGNLQKAIRREPNFARPQNLGSGTASGVGPRVVYEAADAYQAKIEDLGSIADQSGFQLLGADNGQVFQGPRDTPPPPNPVADPWQDWLRRFRAQQARARNAANGINAARALQLQQLQQAQQLASQMQQAMQQAADATNQLQQMLAPCANANANSNQGQNPARNGSQTGNTSASGKANGAKGGLGGGAKAAIALGVTAPLGYYLYNELYACGAEPTISDADAIACGQGSCRACQSFEQFLPYCECMEEKHPEDQGICAMVREAVDALYSVCRAPAPATRARPDRR